jgi:hypothetical protein
MMKIQYMEINISDKYIISLFKIWGSVLQKYSTFLSVSLCILPGYMVFHR